MFYDFSCLNLATILEENDTIKTDLYISIYQVCYKYTHQVKKFTYAIEKHKVTTLDWIDSSTPVKFYHKNLSVYIFMDFSDEKNAVRFDLLTDRAIQLLDNQM
jgi:hypothetical protein